MKRRESVVEVALVGLLQIGNLDRLGHGPQHIVGLAVVDHQPEHGQRVGCAIHLIHLAAPGWAVVRDELEFEDQVGVCRGGHQLKLAGSLERRVELDVGAARGARERGRKQPAVGPGIGDEDLFGREDGWWYGCCRGAAGLLGEGGNRRKKGGAYEVTESETDAAQREFLLRKNTLVQEDTAARKMFLRMLRRCSTRLNSS